ncbi:hypothetical protein BDA96_02G269400 [Sorghum bicolor]|uniref:Uncharacterized protein n=2 Tax=Sorghum bicolor TaxID=4558 RepID=A0A921RQY4_SORBI|nr:hypothetical protein BDA96_02G269400 [Sorghum bicolor]KAG0544370.1 hypothetical protein BDA96_02G269400 [Sorghum bicolor]OQU89745.1 hypothetical protein SORBI_3002G257150 [Sorghum bicolor]
MRTRVPLPRLVPAPVERHHPCVRLGVHEPAVGRLVQVVRVAAVEEVARHGHVGAYRDARVPQPMMSTHARIGEFCSKSFGFELVPLCPTPIDTSDQLTVKTKL